MIVSITNCETRIRRFELLDKINFLFMLTSDTKGIAFPDPNMPKESKFAWISNEKFDLDEKTVKV